MICVTLKHERNNFHSRRKDDLQWRVHFFVTFQWLVNRLEYCHKDRGCVCRGLALLCNCSFNDLSFTMYLFKINVRIVCVFILDYTCAFDEYYLEWMSVFNGCCSECTLRMLFRINSTSMQFEWWYLEIKYRFMLMIISVYSVIIDHKNVLFLSVIRWCAHIRSMFSINHLRSGVSDVYRMFPVYRVSPYTCRRNL